MKLISGILILVFFGVLASCGNSSEDIGSRPAIPRRPAYPRIELPDSVFGHRDRLPLGMEVNESSVAEITRDDASGVWINVTYPGQNAQVYYTFTPVTEDGVAEVLDNRLERISLNLGGNSAKMTEFLTPSGLAVRLFEGGNVATPVQFLATDNATLVVSGSAFLPELSPATSDSLSPVVKMLERDIVHSLQSLKND